MEHYKKSKPLNDSTVSNFVPKNAWKHMIYQVDKQVGKNKNLHCLIDLTFRDINRLLVLSFKNCNSDPTRNYFDKYYMSLAEKNSMH